MKCTYCHQESSGRVFCPSCMRRADTPKRYKNKKIPCLFAREILLFCLAAVLCGAVCLFAAWHHRQPTEESVEPELTESQTGADTSSPGLVSTEPEISEVSSAEPDSTTKPPEPAVNDVGTVISEIRRELDSQMVWSPIATVTSTNIIVVPANSGQNDEELIRSLVRDIKRSGQELVHNSPNAQIYYYISVDLQDEKPSSMTIYLSSQSSSSEPA